MYIFTFDGPVMYCYALEACATSLNFGKTFYVPNPNPGEDRPDNVPNPERVFDAYGVTTYGFWKKKGIITFVSESEETIDSLKRFIEGFKYSMKENV